MYFSCKISNAILAHLERRGEDLSRLYDMPLPTIEVLRDPSSWISAPEMENFLEAMAQTSWSLPGQETLLVEAGHDGPQLRAWGVLDSVLRMMPRPQEIFHQPERFLSYFISPQPPIENLVRTDQSIEFDLPLPAQQYPLVTSYLMAAFESLPVYVGQSFARCEWVDIHLQILWPEEQDSIFAEDPGHQLSPELLNRVVEDHQRLQRELEEKNREIQSKEQELMALREDLAREPQQRTALQPGVDFFEDFSSGGAPIHRLGQNLARLHDYMVRAQQLITVLAGHSKANPTLKEALRRLDWDHVKTQYPRTIADSVDVLRNLSTKKNLPMHQVSREENLNV